MRARRVAILALCAAALGAGDARAQQVTVYSSLPLVFPDARAVANGAQLALEQAGGRAGALSVRYVSLDDSSRSFGSWTPEREAANAARASDDASAVAYIGAFNSGASAVSIPITNEAGLLQLSPTNTYTGLTRRGAGVFPGDPDKYYPTGVRTYARLAPHDGVQGRALGALVRRSRCRRLYVLHDGESYGSGLARSAARAARSRGVRVVALRRAGTRPAGHRRLARRVRRSRARCVLYGGITANNAASLFRALVRAVPRVRLFGADGVADSAFVDPREGGLPARVARRVRITLSVRPRAALPAAGQRVLDDYAARFGDSHPDPYAVNGYEAMALVLDAIRAAGADRAAVMRAVFATRDRAGALGTYSIDAHGDTTLKDFGVYRISRGALVFERVVRP